MAFLIAKKRNIYGTGNGTPGIFAWGTQVDESGSRQADRFLYS